MKKKINKSDKMLILYIKLVIKGLEKRIDKKPCEPLTAGCFECETRILIAYLYKWLDVLEYE